MIKFKILMLISLICLISSCQPSKKSIERNLKKCVNKVVNDDIKAYYGKKPFDFYSFTLGYEKALLQNKFLKDTSKKAYKSLLNDIIDYNLNDLKKLSEIQNSMINEFGFGLNQYKINEGVFSKCFYEVSYKTKDGVGKEIYDQGKIYNKILINGFDNMKLIEEAFINIEDENFDNIIYKAPILLLVMINVKNHSK